MTLGNTLVESTTFNNRLQPAQINVPGLLALDFTYDPPDPLVNNNGNIYTQQIRANAQLDVTQTYTYDAVNRLSSATEGGWQRDYYYDAFGNRAVKGSGVAINYPQCALATDPGCAASDFTADNRLSSTFAAYDAAGNQTVLKYPGNPLFSASTAYDANNKQRYFCDGTEAACPAAVVTGEYRYDAGGNRVEKIVGANVTTYVYNAFGQVAAEYETAPQTMGREPGRFFRTTDHLGSTRLVTRADGTVKTRRDFFPFGEEILDTYATRQSVTDLQPDSTQASTYKLFGSPNEFSQQFTGQRRDEESGLDYFLARYHSGELGRFTTPDPVGGSKANPQSMNQYAYVLNNPLAYVDPTGLVVEWHDSKAKCKDGETECRTGAQRKFENRLEKLRNSDDDETRAKGEKLTETYDRLKSSKAVFEVVKGGSSGSSRGEISYSGNNHFTIELTGGGQVLGLNSTQKLAHEFEHGRQILDGELSFQNYTGAWLPFGHDLIDEAKGFEATFAIEPATPGNGRILNGFQDALRRHGVVGLAEHLGRVSSYQNVPVGPTNVSPNMPPAIYKPPR
jgi:RHS repeat-associated protein